MFTTRIAIAMRRLLFTVLLCSLAPQPGSAIEIGSSFIDRFSHLSRARWFVSDGWANGDHQACMFSAQNITIDSAGLQLMLLGRQVKDRKQTCAEVQSLAAFGYGTFEFRMRPAAGAGIDSGVFTYSGPPAQDQPHDEIDLEFLGRYSDKVQLNYFVNGQTQGNSLNEIPANAFETMNTYAIQWFPDKLRWFVNGKLLREVVRKEGAPYPTHPSKIYLTIWNTSTLTDWLGTFDSSKLPMSIGYEWVAYTKAGEPCQFPESILCSQKD